MNLEVNCACSKETQVGSELGLNREIALNNSVESRDHLQDGGEKKMKKKLLVESIVLTTLIAVMLSVGLVHAGHYDDTRTRNGGGGGYVTAEYDVYFDDQTYVIDVEGSSVDTDYGISAGSCSLQERKEILNTANAQAFIRSDFFPSVGSNYGMYADTWTYPSYTSDPFGGSTGWWLI